MEYLLIPLMAYLSHLEGTGTDKVKLYLKSKKLQFLPCLLFGLCFSLPYLSDPIFAIVVGAYAFFAKNTGHGVALNWGKAWKIEDAGDKNSLSPFVECLARLVKIPLFQSDGYSTTLNYCRLFMAVKGLCLSFLCFPVGLLMIVLQPLSYEIGNRVFKTNAASEWLSGAAAGLCLVVML